MPHIAIVADAILFDMDGTLVDSTAGVVGAWELFQQTYMDIDINDILNSAHGIRTVDNLRKYCKIQDLNVLEKEAERFENAILSSSKENGLQGIITLPGVEAALEQLVPRGHRSQFPWAICTSATRAYASSALRIAGIPVPDVFITAQDVNHGKPAPDPYLLGAKHCGVHSEKCVVFEDAPSGIRSGNAAGCKTVGLLTTHTRAQIEEAKPDFIIKDLSCVSLKALPKGVEITIFED